MMASRLRIPSRVRALRSTSGSGPASISTACEPSLTRIASPWPTSRTTSAGPPKCGIPDAANTSARMASDTITRACRLERGNGHHAHIRAPASRAPAPSIVALASTPTAAPGSIANWRDRAETPTSGQAATFSTAPPTLSDTSPARPPTSPTASATVTSGTATTFASGETSDTTWNRGIATGSVAPCATSVSATGAANKRPLPPSAHSVHRVAREANSSSPATAETERRNPMSNAMYGLNTSIPAAAAESAATPSRRRPLKHARPAIEPMVSARTEDGCTPVINT